MQMRILHILRSEPTELVRLLAGRMSQGETAREVPLFRGGVDYAQLVKDIFESDLVVCWW
jgi:hypothetical protein